MDSNKSIEDFLAGASFAVVGASRDREKYGNKVLRAYQQQGLTVFPVNPKEQEIEGLKAYPDLASLPQPVHGISIITPPKVTEAVVAAAAQLGIQHVWMQPGAESEEAERLAHEHHMNLISGGPCALVVMGYRE